MTDDNATTSKRRRQSDDDDDDDEEKENKDPRKKTKENDDDSSRPPTEEFATCAGELLFALHRSLLFSGVTAFPVAVAPYDYRDGRGKDMKLILREFTAVATSSRMPWRTFWRDVYGFMCKSMHFFNVPRTLLKSDPTTTNRLFCPSHLETIARSVTEQYGVRHNQLLYDAFREVDLENWPRCAGWHNDVVYKDNWSLMRELTAAYIDIVWRTIDRHGNGGAAAPPYDELCDYLGLTYETAMIGGCPLLAAPLSQFAPLRIVQLLNDMLERNLLVEICYENHGCMFDATVALTLVAAMQYSVLLRGLRPVELWPFVDESDWPEFILVHTAMTAHYFLTGLSSEILSGQQSRKRREYIDACKLKSTGLIASCAHNEYAAARRDTSYLSKYLDLERYQPLAFEKIGDHAVRQMVHAFNPERDSLCLLARQIVIAGQLCYSCNSRCAMYKILSPSSYDDAHRSTANGDCYWVSPYGQEEDDEDEDGRRRDETPPPALPNEVQCNHVSSTVADASPTRYYLRSIDSQRSCALSAVATTSRYSLEDNNALTNMRYVNLLMLRTHSASHDALLAYQAFGLRSFPYNYDLGAHLDIARHLFVAHTTRLIRAPLPSRATLNRAVGKFVTK